MPQSATEPDAATQPLKNQLLCCKSIDKLISEAEDPEHRLSKSLGPWSLTALGIGAIIGSGIFVLTGTAAAGEYFQAPSILHAQVLDLIANFLRTGSTAGALMHGRPPAGPSIAISFFLVAIACSFAGLCYAELASMIPVAGSAYSYAYATLGELVAWFIGWNLVLEYTFSVATVAVGWSAYVVSLLADWHIHMPAALVNAPLGVDAHDHLITTGAIINVPAVLIIAAMTALLYVGVRWSAHANTLMVALKVGIIIIIQSWSFCPNTHAPRFKDVNGDFCGAIVGRLFRSCASPS